MKIYAVSDTFCFALPCISAAAFNECSQLLEYLLNRRDYFLTASLSSFLSKLSRDEIFFTSKILICILVLIMLCLNY